MNRPPRGLTAAEAELWHRVSQTVAPIHPPRLVKAAKAIAAAPAPPKPQPPKARHKAVPAQIPSAPPRPKATSPATLDQHGLDGTWERKLARAAISPDFTLDLHGFGLDAAHDRLDHGLTLALAQQARLVLVIAGKPRPVDAADRGSKRGAIRAKLLDWLAAGPHASRIAAVRSAHPRHGGAGAVYVVLKRER